MFSDYRPVVLSREQGEMKETSVRNNGGILKRGVMAIAVAPSCPLNVGVLDSSDCWTDEALVSAVRPLSAHELHRLALGSERERRHQQGNDLKR